MAERESERENRRGQTERRKERGREKERGTKREREKGDRALVEEDRWRRRKVKHR